MRIIQRELVCNLTNFSTAHLIYIYIYLLLSEEENYFMPF